VQIRATILTILLQLIFATVGHARKPLGKVRVISPAPGKNDIVGAVVDNGVWVSVDGGKNWKQKFVLPLKVKGIKEQQKNQNDFIADKFTDPGLKKSDNSLKFISKQNDRNDSDANNINYLHKNQKILLAIDDTGGFALWYRSRLYVNKKRVIPLISVRWIQFDWRGRLWLLAGNQLKILTGGSLVTIDTIKDTAGGALDRHRRKIWIISKSGLWSFNAEDDLPAGYLYDSIVADDIYIALNGDIYLLKDSNVSVLNNLGKLKHKFIADSNVVRIVAGERHNIWFCDDYGHWFYYTGLFLKRTEFTDIAISSAGQIWKGTVTGPLLSQPVDLNVKGSINFNILRYVLKCKSSIDKELGAAPKESYLQALMPSFKFKTTFGRLNGKGITLFPAVAQHWSRTFIYFGFGLIWSLKPIRQIKYQPAKDTYIKIIKSREKRVRHMAIALAKTDELIKTEKNPLTKVLINMERNKYLTIIHHLCGR
jgi:hypothetical protein